ncbi:MAG TPA: ROK family protein [Opitutaceae bacterium]|nr:ROK family protein [Opitutaceae bacterium]
MYIGIDLGGTRVKAAAFDQSGVVLHEAVQPTQDGVKGADGKPVWAGAVKAVVAEMETTLGLRAEGIGLAAPGLVAKDQRSIAYQPGKLEGLEGFDWTRFLQRELKVPVLNDAHAALLGEAWRGAAAGRKDVVMLTLGTGVGGAILSDGRLLRGHLGRAGHLGHVSLDPNGAPSIFGMPGSLEDEMGERTVRERCGGRFPSTHTLVTACRAGDREATDVWLKSVRAVGVALAGYINAFDPEMIIIGGGIAQAGDALFIPLAKVLDEVEWRPAGHRVPIRSAQLGDAAGSCGAAWQAMQVNG